MGQTVKNSPNPDTPQIEQKKIGCACACPVTSIGSSVYFVRINLIQEAGKCAWALLIPCEHLELDQGVPVAVNKKRIEKLYRPEPTSGSTPEIIVLVIVAALVIAGVV